MDASERERLIGQYRQGYAAVVEALEGITEDELDRSAEKDGWTPRQIVIHLGDSEMMSAMRIRRLLAEPQPVVHGYDEKAFARLAGDRPIEPSLQAMRWARETCLQLMDRMSEDDWLIVGTHTESAPYGTEAWLRIYASHPHDHADQIRRARRKK